MSGPPFRPGDMVRIDAPGMKPGTVGRVTASRWRTDHHFYIVSVWLASNDELIEVSEKHLKRIEPNKSDLNAKRWKK